MKEGDCVYVSGSVKYGDDEFRVASHGIIQKHNKINSLVLVDNIDGDLNVLVIVPNKYIK